MALKYNPLLKFGLENTGGGGGEAEQIAALQEAVSVLQEQAATLQTALNTLKGNKITKCFSESDFAALEQNEIFEWQGETGNGLQNGYFYKITSAQTTIEPGVKYYQVVNDITIGGITIKANDYYLVNDLLSYINNRIYTQIPQTGNYYAYTLQSNSYKPVVNDIVFDNANNIFLTVESVSGNEMTLSNGATVALTSLSYSNPTSVVNCVALDGTSIVVAPKILNASNKLPIVAVYDGAFVPIVLEPYTEWKLLTTSSEITIPAQFARVNTQPQQLSLVNNQVKYTLADEQTQINLVSDDTFSGTAVNFPSAAVSGNITDGEALGTMAKKIFNFVDYFDFFSPDSRTFLTHSIPVIGYSVIGNSQNLYDNLLPTTATFIAYIANLSESPSNRDGFIIVFKNGKYGIMFILSNGGNIYKRYVDNGTFSAWTLI